MEKSKKAKIFIWSAVIAVIISIISMFFVKVRIQIDYPSTNILMNMAQNDQTLELDTKRFYEDRVFANIRAIDSLNWGEAHIRLICESGTITEVENVQVSVGNWIIKTYTNFNDGYYTGIEQLEEQINSKSIILKSTGNESVIKLFHMKRVIFPYFIIYLMGVFGITYSLSLICVLRYYKKNVDKSAMLHKLQNSTLWYNLRNLLKQVIAICICMCILFFIFFKTSFLENIQISLWEIWFCIFAELILVLQLKKRTNNWLIIAGCALLGGIFLWNSIADVTTFLTIDEPNAIYEQSDFQSSNFRHWYLNASYMNFAIMGTIWKFVPQMIIAENYIKVEQLAKLLHWICGIGLLFFIIDQVEHNLIRNKKWNKAIIYTFLLVGLLAIPIVPEALKNYNYDLFSMLFGILGIVELHVFLLTEKKKHAISAILCLTFGIIEKVIVFPAWFIGATIIGYSISEKDSKYIKNKYVKMFLSACKVVVISIFFVFLIQKYVFSVLRVVSPICGIRKAAEMFFSTFDLGIRVISKILHITIDGNYWIICSAVVYIVGLWILIIIMDILKHKECKRGKVFGYMMLIFTMLGIVNRLLLPLFTGKTFIVSWLNFCGMFVESFPTLVLIIILYAIFVSIKNMCSKEWMIGMLLVGGGMSIVYTISGIGSARYSDLYISLFALYAYIIICNSNILSKNKFVELIAVGCCLITLFEVAGSQPAFTYFVPYWNIIPSSLQNRELFAYWGENWVVMLDVLSEYCKEQDIEENKITLNCSYPGLVLKNNTNINIGQYWWREEGYDENELTENQYFVFENRSVQREQITYGLPVDAEPVITVKYHGTITARIYKGSDLKKYFKQYID